MSYSWTHDLVIEMTNRPRELPFAIKERVKTLEMMVLRLLHFFFTLDRGAVSKKCLAIRRLGAAQHS